MYFSVIILNAPEGPSLTYDLVFHPTPCWFQGHKMIFSSVTLNSLGFGDLLNLISKDTIEIEDGYEINSKFHPQKYVKIICHKGGHGSEVDLNNLINEIKEIGFEVLVF